MTIIYFILLLTVIICIHEAGHLFAAKKFGVYCYEYSFGMGPVIWKRKKGETQYSIRAIPIGGFVAMAGEQDGDAAYPDVTVPDGRRLTDKPWWQKVIIMLAGVFMNFVLCWVIFSLIILHAGSFAVSPKAVIEEVISASPAEAAGLEAGDEIEAIVLSDGTEYHPSTYQELQLELSSMSDQPIQLTVLRDGKELTVSVTPEYNEEYQYYMIGIRGPSAEMKDVNLLNCWGFGAQEMWTVTKLMMSAIRNLFAGRNLNQLSGPVGIYQATEQTVSYGFSSFLFLMAELSLNVGIFNLIPLPVLDGGQVVITIAEAIAHRKLNEKVKIGLMGACWVLLIALMLFVTWNDVSRMIG